MNKTQILKRIWSLCAPFRFRITFVSSCLLMQQVVIALIPLALGVTVTSITTGNRDAFVKSLFAWVALRFVQVVILYLRELFEIHRLDYDMQQYLANVSMEKFFTFSLGQHHTGHSIVKRSVINKGKTAVYGLVTTAIYEVIPTGLMIVIPILLLLVNVPVVGLMVSLIVALFTVYTLKYNQAFVPRIRKLDTLDNRVAKTTGEFIDNVAVVYANAQEERVKKDCDKEESSKGVEGKPVWTPYIAWFWSGQGFIALSQGLCIGLSGYLTYRGDVSPGMFVTMVMWFNSCLGVLSNIGHIQRNLAKSVAPIVKFFAFLDYKPDITMIDNPIPIKDLKGKIEFRNVTFVYRPRSNKDILNETENDEGDETEEVSEIPALKNVSFTLESGKCYAIVGPSGAGKSTLVGMMMRAHDPQNGHIMLDGVDLRMLDYRELRRNIGLVPQDVALFDGTLRYNVTFGLNGKAQEVTENELEHVARQSRVSEFFGKMEKGWDTLIGERGVKLSGGQRQRVGIARALIKNPQILIFDEATSSLDTENEARIRESIREASIGKTTIIIAHRLATVKDADRIFVFDEGNLVGQGSHEELLAHNEHYARLVHSQVIMA